METRRLALLEAAKLHPFFGEIYLFSDPSTNQIFFVKSIDLSSPEEFRSTLKKIEGRKAVSHPNLITLHDILEFEGKSKAFILAEYPQVSSEDLARRLASPREKIRFLHQILSAFELLESNGLYHGLVRPEYLSYDPIKNRYLLIEHFEENSQFLTFQKNKWQSGHSLYPHPDILDLLATRKQTSAISPGSSDVFSLAMTLIHLTENSTFLPNFYDHEKIAFDFSSFSEFVENLEKKFAGSENEKLAGFLKTVLLQKDPSRFLNAKEALSLFSETFDKEIYTENSENFPHFVQGQKEKVRFQNLPDDFFQKLNILSFKNDKINPTEKSPYFTESRLVFDDKDSNFQSSKSMHRENDSQHWAPSETNPLLFSPTKEINISQLKHSEFSDHSRNYSLNFSNQTPNSISHPKSKFDFDELESSKNFNSHSNSEFLLGLTSIQASLQDPFSHILNQLVGETSPSPEHFRKFDPKLPIQTNVIIKQDSSEIGNNLRDVQSQILNPNNIEAEYLPKSCPPPASIIQDASKNLSKHPSIDNSKSGGDSLVQSVEFELKKIGETVNYKNVFVSNLILLEEKNSQTEIINEENQSGSYSSTLELPIGQSSADGKRESATIGMLPLLVTKAENESGFPKSLSENSQEQISKDEKVANFPREKDPTSENENLFSEKPFNEKNVKEFSSSSQKTSNFANQSDIRSKANNFASSFRVTETSPISKDDVIVNSNWDQSQTNPLVDLARDSIERRSLRGLGSPSFDANRDGFFVQPALDSQTDLLASAASAGPKNVSTCENNLTFARDRSNVSGVHRKISSSSAVELPSNEAGVLQRSSEKASLKNQLVSSFHPNPFLERSEHEKIDENKILAPSTETKKSFRNIFDTIEQPKEFSPYDEAEISPESEVKKFNKNPPRILSRAKKSSLPPIHQSINLNDQLESSIQTPESFPSQGGFLFTGHKIITSEDELESRDGKVNSTELSIRLSEIQKTSLLSSRGSLPAVPKQVSIKEKNLRNSIRSLAQKNQSQKRHESNRDDNNHSLEILLESCVNSQKDLQRQSTLKKTKEKIENMAEGIMDERSENEKVKLNVGVSDQDSTKKASQLKLSQKNSKIEKATKKEIVPNELEKSKNSSSSSASSRSSSSDSDSSSSKSEKKIASNKPLLTKATSDKKKSPSVSSQSKILNESNKNDSADLQILSKIEKNSPSSDPVQNKTFISENILKEGSDRIDHSIPSLAKAHENFQEEGNSRHVDSSGEYKPSKIRISQNCSDEPQVDLTSVLNPSMSQSEITQNISTPLSFQRHLDSISFAKQSPKSSKEEKSTQTEEEIFASLDSKPVMFYDVQSLAKLKHTCAKNRNKSQRTIRELESILIKQESQIVPLSTNEILLPRRQSVWISYTSSLRTGSPSRGLLYGSQLSQTIAPFSPDRSLGPLIIPSKFLGIVSSSRRASANLQLSQISSELETFLPNMTATLDLSKSAFKQPNADQSSANRYFVSRSPFRRE